MTRTGRAWAAVLLVAGLSACAREGADPLTIAANGIWPGYQPLFLARDLGYLDEVPARLREMPSSSLAMAALRTRSVDAAALTLDEVFLLVQDGTETRAVLVMDVSSGADVLVGRPEIRGIGDLRGKRVGVESTALGAYMLSRALERGGLAAADVRVVPVALDLHERTYRERRVEAIVTFEPVRTRLLAEGARVLFDSSQIPGEIVDVLVVRQEVLRSQPGQLQRLLDAWYRALDHLRGDPEDACRRIARRAGIDCREIQASLGRIRIPDRAENERLLAGPSPALLSPAERLADVMLRNGLLRRQVEARRLFSIASPDRRGPP